MSDTTTADRLAEQEDSLPPESVPGQRSAAEHLRGEAESFDAMARNDRDNGEPPALTDQWEAARDELNAEADRIEDAADERAWDAASLQDGVQDALNEASRARQRGDESLAQFWDEEAASLATESQVTTTGQERNVPDKDGFITDEEEAALDRWIAKQDAQREAEEAEAWGAEYDRNPPAEKLQDAREALWEARHEQANNMWVGDDDAHAVRVAQAEQALADRQAAHDAAQAPADAEASTPATDTTEPETAADPAAEAVEDYHTTMALADESEQAGDHDYADRMADRAGAARSEAEADGASEDDLAPRGVGYDTPTAVPDRAATYSQLADETTSSEDADRYREEAAAARGAASEAPTETTPDVEAASDTASDTTEAGADPKDGAIDWEAVMADLDQIPDATDSDGFDAWADDTDTDADHDREVAGA